MRATHQQHPPVERRERSKSVNTVAAKMKQVVERMISAQKDGDAHPQLTVFLYKSQQSEITNAFLVELQKENAGLFQDRDAFATLVMMHYDEFTATSTYSTLPSLSATNPLEPSSGASIGPFTTVQ
jgi:hypothetical protein